MSESVTKSLTVTERKAGVLQPLSDAPRQAFRMAPDHEQSIMQLRSGQIDALPLIFKRLILTAIIIVIGPIGAMVVRSFPSFPYREEVLIAVYVVAIGLPLLGILSRVLYLATLRYTVSTQRVTAADGVFSRSISAIELYRIRDINVVKPFHQRLFRRGVVTVRAATQGEDAFIRLIAVKHPELVAENIRTLLGQAREANGVHIVE